MNEKIEQAIELLIDISKDLNRLGYDGTPIKESVDRSLALLESTKAEPAAEPKE